MLIIVGIMDDKQKNFWFFVGAVAGASFHIVAMGIFQYIHADTWGMQLHEKIYQIWPVAIFWYLMFWVFFETFWDFSEEWTGEALKDKKYKKLYDAMQITILNSISTSVCVYDVLFFIKPSHPWFYYVMFTLPLWAIGVNIRRFTKK